jgi:hypothetical protein
MGAGVIGTQLAARPVPVPRAAVVPLVRGRGAWALSSALVAVTVAACLIALLQPNVIRSPAVTVGNMQGTALVLLVVTMPLLVMSMAAVGRGHERWVVGWLGALGSAWYQSVLFLFGTPFNPSFHLYVAMLALAAWGLLAVGVRLRVVRVERVVGVGAPRRVVAGYLLLNAAMFALLWLQATVPAVLDPSAPAFLAGTGMVTGPVQVIDLAFTLPLMALAAWLLLTGRRWGRVLTGSLLVMLAIETASIGVDQWFGHAADPASPAASASLTPVFGVLTALGVGVLALFLRAGRPDPGDPRR